MALLDVSEVITDPLFTSSVTLIARSLSYDENGNPVWNDEETEEVQAVVTSDMKAIERLSDALRREGTILVRILATALPLGFSGGGYDALVWRGKRFVIKDTADYTQFGQGFLRMVCHPEEVTDGGY